MKLVRYGKPGQEKPGLIDAEGRLRDLSAAVADIGPGQLSDAALARLRKLKTETLPLVKGSQRMGCPVASVGKFIAIGLNYADHAAEAGMPIPAEPIVFMKATSCIQGADDLIMLPKGSKKSDWEVELGVVIGRQARHVSQKDALAHVAGYCVVNDVSERAFQIERGGTWDKGKGCDTFGPIGPWLVTRNEIATRRGHGHEAARVPEKGRRPDPRRARTGHPAAAGGAVHPLKSAPSVRRSGAPEA
jgi:2-keto-4-pentenoate hydratase/2-oxohepta-3-ene-1,7-dioic acid hydratase in catechol pathway